MDTENELAADAYHETMARLHPQAIEYQCAILGCRVTVEDIEDFNHCENCSKRICEGHSRKRSVYWMCFDCDRAERDKLAALLPERLMDAAEKIRERKLNAEEAQHELFGLYELAGEIEGSN